MQAKVRKIGRKHYLIFPKNSVRALSLYPGSSVNLDVENGTLKIELNIRRRYHKRTNVMRRLIKNNLRVHHP